MFFLITFIYFFLGLPLFLFHLSFWLYIDYFFFQQVQIISISYLSFLCLCSFTLTLFFIFTLNFIHSSDTRYLPHHSHFCNIYVHFLLFINCQTLRFIYCWWPQNSLVLLPFRLYWWFFICCVPSFNSDRRTLLSSWSAIKRCEGWMF